MSFTAESATLSALRYAEAHGEIACVVCGKMLSGEVYVLPTCHVDPNGGQYGVTLTFSCPEHSEHNFQILRDRMMEGRVFDIYNDIVKIANSESN